MAHLDFVFDAFAAQPDDEAIIWRDGTYRYGWLLEQVRHWKDRLQTEAVHAGAVVALEADFSPHSVAAFLALIDAGYILVPLSPAVRAKRDEFLEIAEVEIRVALDSHDQATLARVPTAATHGHYVELRSRQHPGLVLFSSGSTGKSKAAVHDMVGILEKFKQRRHTRRTMAFLMFDHIGGINTMLYTLSNGGCMVTTDDRSPDGVLRAIERYRVELLPTSPTFLNLVLLSEAYKRYDLTSLQLITYGTEPMPEGTLARVHALLPGIELLQTYGLSEVGILRSKSRSSDSLWVKVGGEGFQTRIVDGILQIRSRSAMLGYLNAASPFTDDGWFVTGDAVEQDGEYLRIRGRQSEIINVGGEKVHPAEVESAIQGVENIAAVLVYKEANPITGNMVCAQVSLIREEDPKAVARRVKQHCREQLRPFQVPVKVNVVEAISHSERFKKQRIQ